MSTKTKSIFATLATIALGAGAVALGIFAVRNPDKVKTLAKTVGDKATDLARAAGKRIQAAADQLDMPSGAMGQKKANGADHRADA